MHGLALFTHQCQLVDISRRFKVAGCPPGGILLTSVPIRTTDRTRMDAWGLNRRATGARRIDLDESRIGVAR